MSFSYSDFAAALERGAPIAADDVLALRRWVWPDGAVSDAEAEAVFALNRLARDAGPEWADFLIEAIALYVVDARPPKGYVDEAGAAWLIDQVDRDGCPITALELALVVKVLEKSLNCPPVLKAWALRQIEEKVLRDGEVAGDEAALLRRVLFAAGGDGALKISGDEAELLWRLKDACLTGDNDPAWKTLFVQAVGNHLMAWSSYTPLERGEAARLEAFVNDHRTSVLGFFTRMRTASPADGLRALSRREQSAAEHDAEVEAARAVTPDEDAWLSRHVDADGARDDYEEALLAFVAEESGR